MRSEYKNQMKWRLRTSIFSGLLNNRVRWSECCCLGMSLVWYLDACAYGPCDGFDGSMTVYDDICDATRQGLIEHSTEPQCIYPYVFRMVPVGTYSSTLYSRVIVESLEWIATPEDDMSFWRERSSPRLCPETAKYVICRYYKASVPLFVSKSSHQYY